MARLVSLAFLILEPFLFHSVWSLLASSDGVGAAPSGTLNPKLPLFIVRTGPQPFDSASKSNSVQFSLCPNPVAENPSFGSSDEFSRTANIWGRGSSSAAQPKRSYRLSLKEDSGLPLKAAILGMPKESDWILYAAYSEKVLMRDVLAYELWRSMGHYSVRWRYVELFIVTNSGVQLANADKWFRRRKADFRNAEVGWNEVSYDSTSEDTFSSLDGADSAGTLHPPMRFEGRDGSLSKPGRRAQMETGNTLGAATGYEGVYILMEKIKRGKHRLNIQKLYASDNEEPEITGGYIFKKDRLNPGEKGFTSSQGIKFAFEEPKERDVTPAQKEWLANYVNEFERVLFSENFADPLNGYAKYIDVDSFIDYHWMVEASRQIDGYFYSQFYHKDRGGKLAMGPIWDWNISFGNAYSLRGYETNGWHWEQVHSTNYTWFGRLFEDPDFLQKYIDRWAVLRTNVFATYNVLLRIDQWAAQLKDAQVRNYQRWPTLGKFPHPTQPAGSTYQDEVNWLKQWIVGRLAWIDSQGFPAPAFQVTSFPGQSPSVVTLSCATGKIFYTLDGSDPRLPGGGISGKAVEYVAPLHLLKAAVLSARVRSEYELWSPMTIVRE